MQIGWQRVRRNPGIPRWAVLLVGLWLALVLGGVAMEQVTGNSVVVCWFRAVTGIPCPTCGSTRALCALARGRIVASVAHNPLVVAVGVLGLGWLAARVGFGRRVKVSLGVQERRAAWLLAAALLLANWAYVVVRHLEHANPVVP